MAQAPSRTGPSYNFQSVYREEKEGEREEKFSQQQWASSHTASSSYQAADSTVNPTTMLSKLSLNARPHPQLYHLYLRTHDGAAYNLVKDPQTLSTKIIRVYGKETDVPNYVSISNPASNMPKEAFVFPSTKYSGSRSYPKKTMNSSSYPTGVNTYYCEINGSKLEFDRGHCIPHADTLEHNGLISTKDAENYVPQNIKYNHPIRSSLEQDLRKKKLSYKEISIYHSEFMYDVSAGQNRYRIPIPEGFLFFSFTEKGDIQDSYYFPNLVDFEKLKEEANYGNFIKFHELYRFKNLSEWFLVPEATIGLSDEQQDKVNLADRLATKILLFSKKFFSDLSEKQMPPKARVALLTTLFEWNMEAAATLEFVSLELQLQLAHYYLKTSRNLWELDARYEREKQLAIQNFLADQHISSTAKEIVKFLNDNLEFSQLQQTLQGVVDNFEGVFKISSDWWKKGVDGVPSGWHLYHKKMILTCKKGKYAYNVTKIDPSDIPKMKEILGGSSNHQIEKAKQILSIINERAKKSSSITEKLKIMRLAHELQDDKIHVYWENDLMKQAGSNDGKEFFEKISLLDLRKIVDYYGFREKEILKLFWYRQFFEYLEKYPSLENFEQIANWCTDGRAAFLQDLEEQDTHIRPCNMLALQIYKALSFIRPDIYKMRFKALIDRHQDEFGYNKSDIFQVKSKPILPPAYLDSLISENNNTGIVLKNLSTLFYHFIEAHFFDKFSEENPQ